MSMLSLLTLPRPASAALPALLLCAFALTGAARAATDTVTTSADSGPGSLRATLAASAAGDTVTFAPTVTRITLTSGALQIAHGLTLSGPGVTVSGGHASRVFEVGGGTRRQPVALGGLTIENGSARDDGGGVRMDDYVTLTGCTLTGNRAQGEFGGGLCNRYGEVTLTGCALTNNSASGSGGGLYSGGTATLTGCALVGNSAGEGGALAVGRVLTLTDCTLAGNSASGPGGGGLYDPDGRATLTGCTLAGNSAPGGDGGGLLSGGDLTLTACALVGNSARFGGGGLYNLGATLTLTACALAANSTPDGSGGGLFNGGGTATLTGCTLTQNGAPDGSGGGLYNCDTPPLSDGTATLTDDLLYGDSAPTGPEVYNSDGGTDGARATYCDIQGGYPGTGDLGADPLFVGAPADLRVRAGSPVAVAGVTVSGNTTDISGRTRAAPPAIGAYEAVPAAVTAGARAAVPAAVTGVAVTWGGRTAALNAGPSLLPPGRGTDVPWAGIRSFTLTLGSAAVLAPGDVKVTGRAHGPYAFALAGSGTTYTVTLARPITAADRVTLSVGNAGVTAFRGTLPVLPGDISGDGAVTDADWRLALSAAGTADVNADISGEGAVGDADYHLARALIRTALP